jgi:hypothetical protein
LELQSLSINNPTLGFRLDPGEPGMLRSGKATQATLLVTGQEHRNLVHLKSEAIRDGRVIMSANVKFGRAFKGAFLTTTNGLTTVVSRPAREGVLESESERFDSLRDAGQTEGPVEEIQDAAAPAVEDQAPAFEGSGTGQERVLAEQENQLRAELRRLETPGVGEPVGGTLIAGLNREDAGEDDPLRLLEHAADRRAEAGRQAQTRQVESDLRRIQFQKLAGQLVGISA